MSDLKDRLEIRDLAVKDHIEGRRPSSTEHSNLIKGMRLEVATADCKHCDGKGKCDCSACTLRRVAKPVACSMCRLDAHEAFLICSQPVENWFEVEKDGRGLCP